MVCTWYEQTVDKLIIYLLLDHDKRVEKLPKIFSNINKKLENIKYVIVGDGILGDKYIISVLRLA